MRAKFLSGLFILFYCIHSYSQDTIPISKIDTLIPFWGTKSFRSNGYNNRVVPFNSKNPLYVNITFEKSNKSQYEYFRIDSSKYLVYEYFRDAKHSSIDGIKSRGVKVVKDIIVDKSTNGVTHIGQENKHSRQIHYFKDLVKEGEWQEFEDSVFHNISWRGNYANNKRTGIWKRLVYGVIDNLIIEEVDYSKDSTHKIYNNNIVKTISVDSLKRVLQGRWHLKTCEVEPKPRMFYRKCEKYEGNYGDDCNNSMGIENYYDFVSLTKFIRQRGEGCNKFRETCTNGNWKIIEKNGDRFIHFIFANGQIWNLKILYLDIDFNLATDFE
jgi:hypothetical protein